MIPSPWMSLGSIAVAISAYFYGHHAGYAQKTTEDALEIARLNRAMTEAKNEQDVKDASTKQDFETKLSGIIASRPRLFVPVSPSAGCSPATANNGQARAELDGQTAEDLIRIVADGDRAIIDLNSCIDRFNQVRDIANGQH